MKKILVKYLNKSTYGMLAVALFSYVILTGILLAIPFNVKIPYSRVSSILVMNPWASFIRNLHFWSSQLFFIFSLLHLYEHFHKREEIRLKKALGFRLSIGVFIIFLAMLSGFLLRGDADAIQARQIIQSLVMGIPIIGKALAISLLGKGNDYQLIYVHHIATFSIFIAIIIIEHSKRIWPRSKDFIITFIVLAIISYFLSAPLHDNLNPSVKGPWYFVGFQEILHWLSHPVWSVVFVVIILTLIYFANIGKSKIMYFSKRSLLIITGFYIVLTLVGMFFRGENWQLIFPGQANYSYSVLNGFKSERVNFQPAFSHSQMMKAPLIQGRKESCLVCHNKVEGFSEAHKPETIGCFSCHGGNPFATSKEQAHRGMIRIPGNLEDSQQSCGSTQCHSDITQRLPSSLMSTLSGMISVDRFVFKEQDNPDLLTDVHQLAKSAADEHLRNLCVRCHLGNPKKEYGSVTENSRGGGCLACHLNYSDKAKKALNNHKKNIYDTSFLSPHSTLSIQITDDHCFGCHSRSGRISTNFEGWHETTLEPEKMPDSLHYRLVEGNRVFKFMGEDIHHKAGMECVDCHHSYELMGDGKRYAHEEDQEDVQCIDCHFTGKPLVSKAKDLDYESSIIASLRYGNIEGREFLRTHKHSHALVNTFIKGDSIFLITKSKSELLNLKSPKSICTGNKAHENLSCPSCHSSWAPSCIGCHNSYDEKEPGYDMIKNQEKQGSWVEYIGEYIAKLPALGIRETKNKKEIIPVVPGMVLTIDKASFTKNAHDSLIFLRLFAPAAPHTSSAKGRDCKSCHNNPVALGYGEGKLKYKVYGGKGQWTFNAAYEKNSNDDLPQDAWIGFLKEREGKVSTRKDVFPFDLSEQRKILTVGACLTCHLEDSDVMLKSLNNFSVLLKKRSNFCIVPIWE